MKNLFIVALVLLLAPAAAYAQCATISASKTGGLHDNVDGGTWNQGPLHDFEASSHDHSCGIAGIDLTDVDFDSADDVYNVLRTLGGVAEGTATAFLDSRRKAILISSCNDGKEIIGFVPLTSSTFNGVMKRVAEEDDR